MRFAIVLLGAGGSRRLGRPKQLLPFGDGTLIEHAVRTAVESTAEQVIVVLGSYADEVGATLAGWPVEIVINRNWALGMGSSIACGMGAVDAASDAVVLMLCDQPAVTSAHIEALVDRRAHDNLPFVLTDYGGTLGPPAVFGSSLYPDLERIEGDHGAKAIISRFRTVWSLPFAGAAIDVDTEADVALLSHPAS